MASKTMAFKLASFFPNGSISNKDSKHMHYQHTKTARTSRKHKRTSYLMIWTTPFKIKKDVNFSENYALPTYQNSKNFKKTEKKKTSNLLIWTNTL